MPPEAVLAKRGHDGQALFVRARCIEELGNAGRAIQAYQEALVAEPGQVDSLQRLWQLYEKEGRVSDAVTSLETLSSLGVSGPAERLELVRLYAGTGLNSARGIELLEGLPADAVPASTRAELEGQARHPAPGDALGLGRGDPGHSRAALSAARAATARPRPIRCERNSSSSVTPSSAADHRWEQAARADVALDPADADQHRRGPQHQRHRRPASLLKRLSSGRLTRGPQRAREQQPGLGRDRQARQLHQAVRGG